MKRNQTRGPTIGLSQMVPGAIVSDAIYRVDEAKARMGWRDAAFRSACRAGLKTYRVGKRVYVAGCDLAAFVTSEGGQS